MSSQAEREEEEEEIEDEEDDFLFELLGKAAKRTASVAELGILDDLLSAHVDDSSSSSRPRKMPDCGPRPNYKGSAWWTLITTKREVLLDEESKLGKLFRRRFRVPLRIMETIVADCKLWFDHKETDLVGKELPPMELKVMGCLRILGRGNPYDEISEFTLVDESTICRFFRVFVATFRSRMYSTWIRPPRDEEELGKVEEVYRRMGFPGMVNIHSRIL
jgi:hypothetical protein